MRSLSYSLAVLTALTASLPMEAAAVPCCREVPKWYAAIGGSVGFLTNSDIDFGGTELDLEHSTGGGINGAFGYRLFPYMRLEGEMAYRLNTLDSVNGLDPALFLSGSGDPDWTTMALMGNAYFDLDNRSYFTPYVGAGAGIAYFDTNTLLSGQDLADWVLAYQFMGGVTYGAGAYNRDLPLEFYLEYRYFATEDAETESSVVPGLTVRYGYNSHNIQAGARLFLF